MRKLKITLVIAFLVLPPMAWMWRTAVNDPTFIYNIVRWLKAELPAFIVGGAICALISSRVTVKTMRKMYNRRVRRTNQYYKDVKRKEKILKNIDGTLFKIENITKLYTIEMEDVSQELANMREVVKKDISS